MSAALPQPTDVLPGDQRAIEQVEQWFRGFNPVYGARPLRRFIPEMQEAA